MSEIDTLPEEPVEPVEREGIAAVLATARAEDKARAAQMRRQAGAVARAMDGWVGVDGPKH